MINEALAEEVIREGKVIKVGMVVWIPRRGGEKERHEVAGTVDTVRNYVLRHLEPNGRELVLA